jgi:cysteine desulfurase
MDHAMRRIYLDFNATTPIAPSVQEAMLPFLSQHYGNPSSAHALGRAAGEAVEDARGQVASLLGADRDEIVFTACGTESNNLALWGVMSRGAPPLRGHLVVSQFEHPAVAEPARYLQRLGCTVTFVPCNSQGVVQPQQVAKALRPDTQLVSIMHANNEIGTIQPLAEIAALCRERDVLVHTDAAQTVGKIPTLVDELNVDLLTLAGHKFYAPKGVGALYVRRGVALEPLLRGGGHEGGLRPGTENVASIVALGRAAAVASKALEESAPRMAHLRDRLLQHLRAAIGPTLGVNGENAPRLPNTLSVNFPHVSAAELLARAPELMASTGSACHSGQSKMSSTLQAIGLAPSQARGTMRLSVGWPTSEEDIDRAAQLLLHAWENLR